MERIIYHIVKWTGVGVTIVAGFLVVWYYVRVLDQLGGVVAVVVGLFLLLPVTLWFLPIYAALAWGELTPVALWGVFLGGASFAAIGSALLKE